ncbi:hypothetical protein [Marinobacter psychrophilus]|jgi:tetrathionate reductase subunit C|nr:hypothetical protein [Marinobacter psychrophilus]
MALLVWRPAMQEQIEKDSWMARLSGWVAPDQWQAPRWMLELGLELVGLCALVFLLGIMLYTGTEVAVLKYRLLWHTEWLPVKLVISGLFAAETY